MPVFRCPTVREMISYATLKMKEDGTLHRLETKWWYEKGECGSDAGHRVSDKLQALVYDILPSTTAVFSCAIGPTKNVS